MADLRDPQHPNEIVLRSTGPIYRVDERERLELFGTGVFFEYNSQFFIFSAGHVLAELRRRELRIGGEGHIISFTGPFFHTGGIGEVTFDRDCFDVGFVRLSPEQVLGLEGTAFLSLNDIEHSPTLGGRYHATGYIAGDYKVVGPSKPVEPRWSTLWARPAPPATYQTRGVGEDTHLLLSFDRLKTYTTDRVLEATPVISGMSGSGVWRRGSSGVDKLAALLIEHHQPDGKYIVSTRVTTIIPWLQA